LIQSDQAGHLPKTQGLSLGLLAYFLWGFLPLYWKHLSDVPSLQIICHRIIWSAVAMGLVVVCKSRGGKVRAAIQSPSTLRRLALTGSIICTNWLIFIWAVIHGFVIECALGYFISPLVTALLGVYFLHERLSHIRRLALAFAGASVCLLTLSYGAFPWIALSLALTFSLYTLLRKTAAVGSFEGLFIETLLASSLALVYLGYCELQGTERFLSSSFATELLLIGAGPVTAIPLLLFVGSARLIPLSTIAVLQYFSPTVSFLLGVFVFHEPFTTEKFFAFVGVWIAVGLYIAEALWWHPRDARSH